MGKNMNASSCIFESNIPALLEGFFVGSFSVEFLSEIFVFALKLGRDVVSTAW